MLKEILLPIVILLFSSFVTANNRKASIQEDKIQMHIYVGGKPLMAYIEAEIEVLDSLGIEAIVFYGDCAGTYDYKREEFKEKNIGAIEKLTTIYGSNWKEELDKAIRAKMKN